jgi:hypothetical protein
MSRLDKERQMELEPKRIEYAMQKINDKGYEPIQVSETEINFELNGHKIYFFPYSGWHSGSGIKQGRGLSKLLKQI